MPIGLLTLLGGWKNAIIIGVLLVFALVGWYYWNDYQSLQRDHAELLNEYNIASSINEANEDALARMKAQRKQEEAFALALTKKRNEEESKLHEQIAMLQSIQRPDADRLCPIHPAIVHAVHWLRQTTSTDDSQSSAHSAVSSGKSDPVPE